MNIKISVNNRVSRSDKAFLVGVATDKIYAAIRQGECDVSGLLELEGKIRGRWEISKCEERETK